MRHQLRSRKLWNLVKGEETLAEGAERPAVDAFEERCVDATVRLTHAMSPHCCVACAGGLIALRKFGEGWRGNTRNGRLPRSCP